MNEFIIKNGYFSQGNSEITGSLTVTAGITGSLQGTASFAIQALTTSFAPSYVLNSQTSSFITDIKTISGNSLLGSGDLTLSKTDVGLSNVDDTSDMNKPISLSTQMALDAKQDTLVNQINIKSISGLDILGSGDLTLSKTNVGLNNVDDTSDMNKPISLSTQMALDAKQDTLTFLSPLVNNTNTISINQSSTFQDGYLSSVDFTTFNNKQNALPPQNTSIPGATIISSGGTSISDTDTFDGYTVAQIVGALKALGLLT
jgi:hypothetical protein